MATLILTPEEANLEEKFLKRHQGHRIRYIYKDNGIVTLKCYKCHSIKNLSKNNELIIVNK